jgi:hypothetical protein
MANPPPKSRPEPPAPQRPANPQPDDSVYGGEWGSSGKQNTESRPDPTATPPAQPSKPA